MSDSIFLLQPGEQLIEMQSAPYDSETLLQELLAKHPDLLAGSQIDSESPRRWLFVRREYGVPDEFGGINRWSLDHLLLDQDGIPTLIEVKRSTDTRLRREVVGQMLDYAANAVVYWPLEQIRAEFAATCSSRGSDPSQELQAFLEDQPAEAFWQNVKTNLQAGRIRMVFVADHIPKELRRIVEFLNVQMDPSIVLAVEIIQYVGSGMQTLVPRVYGHTSEAQTRKTIDGGGTRKWDEEAVLSELQQRHGKELREVAEKIVNWCRGKVTRVHWRGGKIDGNCFPMCDNDLGKQWIFNLSTTGAIGISFPDMRKNLPFSSPDLRKEYLRRLNEIPGMQLPADSFERYVAFKLQLLLPNENLDRFLSAIDWAVSKIREAEAPVAHTQVSVV